MLASVALSLLLLVCNAHLLGVQATGLEALGEQLSLNYAVTREGEWWRFFTYGVPHLDTQHVLVDVAYLISVWALAGNVLSLMRLATVWYACLFVGGLAAFAFDAHYVSVVGSSTGTHGLLACWCIATRESVRGASAAGAWIRVLVVAALLYLSVAAIFTGRMGWPLQDFRNCGYDHLAGVLFGAMCGFALSRPRRLAERSSLSAT